MAKVELTLGVLNALSQESHINSHCLDLPHGVLSDPVMLSMKEIRERYPELKPPGPRYWLIPAIIVILVVIGWSSLDTEMVGISRDLDDGGLKIDTPNYRWEAALNILAGVRKPVMHEVDGEMVPLTRMIDGEEVTVMHRKGGLIRPIFRSAR